MKRFYYNPRVYVFIRSSTQNGKIYDVSEDVVSGSVTRNIGQVSTAEFVLRNRFRKWLKDPDNKQSIFLPMDMVTIWMQRVGGKPIQVFTGYLDSVPYYQAYPGNCRFTATCTLKKIALTWFDPGLTFFQNIVEDMGWVINPTTGEAINPTALTISKAGKKKINDGGFAKLLYEFMVQICNWQPSNVYISNLPTTLPKKAAELYHKINAGTEKDLNNLEQVMRQVMGITFQSSYTQQNGTLKSNIENITNAVKTKGDSYNINLLILITAAQLLTGYDPKFHQHYKQNPQAWGYGLFAMRPSLTQNAGGNRTIYNEGDSIDGHPIKDLMEVGLATELFCRKLLSVDTNFSPNQHAGQLQRSANAGDALAIKTWIERASGRTFDINTFNGILSTAVSWTKTFNTTSGTQNSINIVQSSSGSTVKQLTWSDKEVTSLMNAREKQIFTDQYRGKIYDSLAPYYFYAKNSVSHQIELSKRWTADKGTLVLTSTAGNSNTLNQFFSGLHNRPEPDYAIRNVLTNSAGVGQPVAYLIGGRTSNGNQQLRQVLDDMHTNTVAVRVSQTAPYPKWDGQKLTQETVGQSTNPDPAAKTAFQQNGLTFQDFGKLSLDAAFTAQLAFPVNYIESQFLTGEKALANDISCLDAIQQFCASSMRTFMSLPNGKFLAFYPDYFGAHGRKPYWPIYDIELINMGIQLNDEAMATHVYVIGDTFSFQNEQLEAFNYIASRGVATLTQASILESLIVPINQHKVGANQKEAPWGRLKDAYAMLQHYGARPLTLNEPLIRNSFYEFLYAWQRFEMQWAQMFNTTVDFTFQPEVMAGGLIAFPQHNLQVFVESVTHTWDYTSGFQTSAQISSPAALQDNGLGVAALPGMALAGGINSVGIGT